MFSFTILLYSVFPVGGASLSNMALHTLNNVFAKFCALVHSVMIFTIRHLTNLPAKTLHFTPQ